MPCLHEQIKHTLFAQIGEPYIVRHIGLLIGRLSSVRHLNLEGWNMSDTLVLRVGKCPTVYLRNAIRQNLTNCLCL